MSRTLDTERKTVPARLVKAGENDRTVFDDADLKTLAAGIAEVGILNPPLVRYHPGDTGEACYTIVYGERRFRAMTDVLGWKNIPVIIGVMDDRTASKAMLVENTARNDLDPIDEAEAYDKRMKQFGLTAAEVADWAGVSVRQVDVRLKFLGLIPQARDMLRRSKTPGTDPGASLPIGFVPAIAKLDPNRQSLALQAWRHAGGMSWWQWATLCDRLENEQNTDPLFDPAAFFQVESYVVDAKATKVSPNAAQRCALVDVIAAYDADYTSQALADAIEAARGTLT
jgi:ParB family chromosome partitioning protein